MWRQSGASCPRAEQATYASLAQLLACRLPPPPVSAAVGNSVPVICPQQPAIRPDLQFGHRRKGVVILIFLLSTDRRIAADACRDFTNSATACAVYCATLSMLARYMPSSGVCVSVCVSVTRRYCVKTAKRRIMQITPGTLVFDAKSQQNSNGVIPTGALNAGG